MWRACLKGAALFAFGRMPGGPHLYREITRNSMGTQATHVDKLARVWPGYVDLWNGRCGLTLGGLDVWIHEGGWTPFPFLANYLLTGSGGVVTNSEGRVLDRYLARAVNGALACDLPSELIPIKRRDQSEALRWSDRVTDAITAIGGILREGVNRSTVLLASESVDLCHSGGALEHYRPSELRAFLKECYRVLRPGGIASHVFDHRDHLHHADRKLPFLAHLALPGPLYQLLCGHKLGYHNRLPPCEVAQLFEEVGFERIAIRRMILPDRRYIEGDEALAGKPGLPRGLLWGRYRRISDADLRTAAAHYIYRKPGE